MEVVPETEVVVAELEAVPVETELVGIVEVEINVTVPEEPVDSTIV